MRYQVKTLGCKANLQDTQLIESELKKEGFTSSSEDPNFIIINSCSVTDEADRQSRKLAEKLKKKNPHAKVIFTGCSAEIDPAHFEKSQGIDYIISNRDKSKFAHLLKSQELKDHSSKRLGSVLEYEELRSRHPMDREWALPSSQYLDAYESSDQSSRTRAFIKVQEGCNSFCTFCIIPYGRGPSRSLKPGIITKEVKKLVSHGVKEIVITGTNIGDYGLDWDPDKKRGLPLVELIELMLEHTTIQRIRISSLDPTEITDELIELMKKEKRICPHFHVSLQSPHSQILRLMKRRYDSEEVISKLAQIEQTTFADGKKAFVGMDVITGFPGETQAIFEEGLELLEKLSWSRMHVFPYSERSSTPATRLPKSVAPSERKKRAHILNELSMKRLSKLYHALVSSNPVLTQVLVDSAGIKGPDGTRSWMSGYSPEYMRVLFKSDDQNLLNELLTLKIQSIIHESSQKDVYGLSSLHLTH